MSVETEPWRRWIPVIEHLLWQNYYRILSFVSYPAPIEESFQAAEELSKTYGGTVSWSLDYHNLFKWEDLEFSPGLKMSIYFVGSAIRQRNTAMIRRGWWKLYLFQPLPHLP